MATLAHKDIAAGIYGVLSGKTGGELDRSLKDVVQFLYKRQLLSKSSQILESLQKIINKEMEIVEVTISSKTSLSPHIKTEVAHFIKERYGAKQVHTIEKIDESLLGGIKMEIGNEVIDLSLKKKISQLQEHLTRNI